MNGSDTVRMDLGDRAYDIIVGAGQIARLGEAVRDRFGQRRAFIVTDEEVESIAEALRQQPQQLGSATVCAMFGVEAATAGATTAVGGAEPKFGRAAADALPVLAAALGEDCC